MKKHSRTRQAPDDNITWGTHIARWMTKATDTHSDYEIYTAFPVQQRLHGHASVFRYMYVPLLFMYGTVVL